MPHTNKLTIIQYNVNKSKDKVQRSFLQALDPEVHHIVAIQELWISPHTRIPSTVKSPEYHSVVNRTEGVPRSCIYISKKVSTEDWQALPRADRDITTIQLTTSHGQILVHSVYNPPPESRSSTQLHTLERLPEAMSQQAQNIVVGDFNLHHPTWGSDFSPAHHFLAGRLISQMETAQLGLVTPNGTETWARNNSSSTLDLCFMSHALTQKVESCKVSSHLESSSDHLPIQTDIQPRLRKRGSQKRSSTGKRPTGH
uniref:Endonuclease/exonuclease/phosphatase domain-containing protein n=1 Tax=Passalora fulva TaxID=5499 RepID=A0A9Q8LFZ7_PASFU